MITIGASNNQSNVGILQNTLLESLIESIEYFYSLEDIFDKYMQKIQINDRRRLMCKIIEILTETTYESMKRSILEYKDFIEQPTLEKNRIKIELSINCYLDDIKLLVTKKISNPNSLKQKEIKTILEKTKLDLKDLEDLEKKIRKEINDDFLYFYNRFCLQTLPLKEIMLSKVLRDCFKKVKAEDMYEFIANSMHQLKGTDLNLILETEVEEEIDLNLWKEIFGTDFTKITEVSLETKESVETEVEKEIDLNLWKEIFGTDFTKITEVKESVETEVEKEIDLNLWKEIFETDFTKITEVSLETKETKRISRN